MALSYNWWLANTFFSTLAAWLSKKDNRLSVTIVVIILFWLNMIKIIAKALFRGGEWYLERRGSRKILTGSRNLGSVFDKSRSLVFAWFVFTFFESRHLLPKSLGLGFLTRVSASRRVSDFTICHPFISANLSSIFIWQKREKAIIF